MQGTEGSLVTMRKLSIRQSVTVSLSVCQTRALCQNERKNAQIFILYERSFSLVFWEKERLVEATPSIP